MSRQILILIVIFSLPAFADDKAQLPDAPGKATVIKVCSNCHGAEIVLGRPHSEEGWSAIIIDMAQRGAQGSEDEFDEVVRYLTKNIKAAPKINVNSAPAKALEEGLGLNEKESQAVVAARAKAPFKSLDDLKKVRGIDAAKIESKKDKLTFE